MITINREMKSKEIQSDYDYIGHAVSQASFNSDGNITLRNYDRYNQDKDEIIVFNKRETEAIIRLFIKLKERDILPF